ncbi:hypothetical protein DICPUDRAFT_82061 [Dictyostelium purpureum]|uniref:RNA helicase n=1 Tax=Dictyostelium purpureum TaxID=5786 RepID=F0ZVE4_DICPU|nr:uncharacterized protein DICPUDRAFT_82061 [Dictyostelium purpureum]EGC32093.1 hypothetical protein DICPUDRAFT_82061 [Dictyostelium purpureum]|eukprot:XP_003291382.1 hypothetical protein DICPUDRAFT_82061 [Dictyostelium purpureum]
MDQLERIELESQVCNELERFIGTGDKVLAEFVISLAEENPKLKDFNKALEENGADFPESLSSHLFNLIEKMKKKNQKTTTTTTKNNSNKSNDWDDDNLQNEKAKSTKFPGLSIANDNEFQQGKVVEVPIDDEKTKRENRKKMDDLDKEFDLKYNSTNSNGSDKKGYDRRDGDRRKELDKEPVLYKIYNGKVSTINDYGCFVSLEGIQGRRDGLVHISQIQSGRVKLNHPSDAVKRNQSVKVKVLSVAGSKISLSMRDVDQESGRDLNPQQNIVSITKDQDRNRNNPSRPSNSGVKINDDDDDAYSGRSRKKISSPERWGHKQLIAAGILSVQEMPNYDEEYGLVNDDTEGVEEDFEIERNEDEPQFLRGTRANMQQLSPIKIVKNPNGSLQRAASTQSALAKERKEEKNQQRNEMMDSMPKDLSLPWHDPMPDPGGRHLAQEIRSIASQGIDTDLPEWKKNTQGSHVSYGKTTSRSIKEQRESLPIFPLLLTMKAMGINDLLNFDFMDPPPVQTLISAMEQLYTLGALDEEGLLTRLGRKMAEFPLDPQLSKMLIASVDLGCSDEILTIVAMLSVQNVFYRPKEKQALADQKKAKFFSSEGDHLTLLNVYNGWKNSKFSNPWCFENFVQARSLRRAQDVKKQLITIMDRYKLDIISCGRNHTKIQKAICSGYFANASKKDPNEGYKTLVEGQPVYIHPSSTLFNRNPDWVIYHELVLTTKEYMREVCTIDPKWLVELAPKFFKSADPNKISKRKRKEKIEPLYDKYNDPNAWRPSKRKG